MKIRSFTQMPLWSDYTMCNPKHHSHTPTSVHYIMCAYLLWAPSTSITSILVNTLEPLQIGSVYILAACLLALLSATPTPPLCPTSDDNYLMLQFKLCSNGRSLLCVWIASQLTLKFCLLTAVVLPMFVLKQPCGAEKHSSELTTSTQPSTTSTTDAAHWRRQ